MSTHERLRWSYYTTVVPGRASTYVLLEDQAKVLHVSHREQRYEEIAALHRRELAGLGSLAALLEHAGALVPHAYDERAPVLALARRSEDAPDKGRTKFHLFMTHTCNFRCVYCIQGHDIKAEQTRMLEVAQVDAAFDGLAYFIDRIPAGRAPHGVTLFGGEPMMPATRSPLLHAVDRAVAMGLGVSAVTNGYYYDRFREPLAQRGILSRMTFLVSLDGPAHVHDLRRPLANGRGSFDRVADNVSRMLDDGASVVLQPIVDEQNADHLQELYAIVEARKWLESGRFAIKCGITMFPNAQAIPGCKGSREDRVLGKVLRFSENPGVQAGFDAVLKRSHFLDRVVRERRPVQVTTGCDAKRAGALSFSPDGMVYPCREYAGHGVARAIGRYWPSPEVFVESFQSWFGWKVSSHPKCSACKHVLLCGGGCRVETETSGRDERVDPLCPDYERIWAAYVEHLESDSRARTSDGIAAARRRLPVVHASP